MNVFTICRKELNSYFRSPIAYGVMFFFALIAGYFFSLATATFVRQGLQAAMMGQAQPMDVNEWVVRNLLSNISVIGLFMCPMITMRLFAEEKRTGTMELLVTSPLHDCEIIVGKWLAALILYACMLALSLLNLLTLYFYGKPDWKPMMIGYLGLLLQGGCMLALGTFISSCTRNQIVAVVATFRRPAAAVGDQLGGAAGFDSADEARSVIFRSWIISIPSPKASLIPRTPSISMQHDLPGPVPHRTGHGIDPVEGVMAQQAGNRRAATLASAIAYTTHRGGHPGSP